jgi:SNF2 family DNA or RNA helicase
VPIRIALTGQPIENRPEELFSIMEFVDPEVLGPFQKFDRTFIVRNHWGRPTRYRNLPLLHEAMADVMYRKSRKDVADQFPRINTAVIPFYLSDVEATMYERVRDYVLNLLLEATSQFGAGFNLAAHYGADHDPASEQMKGDIMAAVMILRQISDDANLVLESAANYDAGKGTGSKLAAELVDAGWFDNVPAVSSKRAMFKEFIEEVMAEDCESKVVGFSTFKGMLRSLARDTASLTRSASLTGAMTRGRGTVDPEVQDRPGHSAVPVERCWWVRHRPAQRQPPRVARPAVVDRQLRAARGPHHPHQLRVRAGVHHHAAGAGDDRHAHARDDRGEGWRRRGVA